METLRSYIKDYISGIKWLFFIQAKQGDRLSLLKIILFSAYILGIVFAFLHFATVTEVDLEANVTIDPFGDIIINYTLAISLFAELAFIMNLIILVGVFFFFITQDQPLSMTMRRIKQFSSRSRLHLLATAVAVIGVSLSGLYAFNQLFLLGGLKELAWGMSYGFGTGIVYMWMVLTPIIFFSTLFLVLDIINQDYKLEGYNKSTISLWFFDGLLVIIIFYIASTVFGVTLATGDLGLDKTFHLLGINFYLNNIFWLLINTIVLFVFAIILILGLFIVDTYLTKKRGPSEFRESRKAILPWFFLFGLILIGLQVAPTLFIFEGRLKTLENILDLLGLALILVLGVFRVTSIPEGSEQIQLEEPNPTSWWKRILAYCNPLNWWRWSPAYCKALFLLFLAFATFYISLEASTVAVLRNTQDEFKTLKLQILIGSGLIGFMYAFWHYKPTKIGDTGSPGSIKQFLGKSREKLKIIKSIGRKTKD
ncbi:MAG: hypothetical protein ACFFC7_16300 [Candidatus Hermodarchaeota archaeon]